MPHDKSKMFHRKENFENYNSFFGGAERGIFVISSDAGYVQTVIPDMGSNAS